MGYRGSGHLPIEMASKLGHMKLVTSPAIRSLITRFESMSPDDRPDPPTPSGCIDMSLPTKITHVIAVDGGQAVLTGTTYKERSMAVIQACAIIVKMADLKRMMDHPMMDPRESSKMFEDHTWYNPAIIPLSGLRFPGSTLQQTIRASVDTAMRELGLYRTLRFLVSREWDPDYQMPGPASPSMKCLSCGDKIFLPRSTLSFRCQACREEHTLSDYLTISEASSGDSTRSEISSYFMNLIETLTIFHFIRIYIDKPDVLSKILFIKDGPLLLRAALIKLVPPIEALIRHIYSRNIPLHLVGVEKSGGMCSFAEENPNLTSRVGEYFFPRLKYLREEIQGRSVPKGNQYRSEYGSKAIVRIGKSHVLAVQVPTGDFSSDPTPDDLVGWDETVRALAELPNYQYENALMPVVMANSAASISYKPSGRIIKDYAWSIIDS
jgi:hypothetical protein